MVGSCLRTDTLPDEVFELAARADGVPFLVEEPLLLLRIGRGVVLNHQEYVVDPLIRSA